MRFLLLALLAAVVGCASVPGAVPARPDKLGLQKVELKIPHVDRWTMPNGLTVYYYYDDEVPLVKGTLYLPGGGLTDPSGIAGLAEATGDQMREGAFTGMSPDELDKRLDSIAASIESGFGDEYGTVSFFSLHEDLPEVFDLFTKVVRQPAFAASRLALWKRLAEESIRRRRDNPAKMAGMTFTRLVYGESSPFAREVTAESLKQINAERMREFHRLFVRPDGAKLAITGALLKEDVKRLVDAKFGDWTPATAAQRPPLPAITHQIRPGVYVLERDFDQATVLIGHRGPPRLTEDQYEMAIYNRVFGHGGFGSMLFREIRSRLGLAYSVYGGLWPGPVEGVFQIDLATRSPETLTAVREAVKLVQSSRSTLPDEKEFRDAKGAAERSFVFKFANPGYLVERAVLLDLLGYPSDYDERYISEIEEVTRDGVRTVAYRRVDPDKFVVVIVGRVKPETVKEALGPDTSVYRVLFDTTPEIQDRPL